MFNKGYTYSVILQNKSHLIRHEKPTIKDQGLHFMGRVNAYKFSQETVLLSILFYWVPDLQVLREVSSWQARNLRRLGDISIRGIHTNMQVLQTKADEMNFLGLAFQPQNRINTSNDLVNLRRIEIIEKKLQKNLILHFLYNLLQSFFLVLIVAQHPLTLDLLAYYNGLVLTLDTAPMRAG